MYYNVSKLNKFFIFTFVVRIKIKYNPKVIINRNKSELNMAFIIFYLICVSNDKSFIIAEERKLISVSKSWCD